MQIQEPRSLPLQNNHPQSQLNKESLVSPWSHVTSSENIPTLVQRPVSQPLMTVVSKTSAAAITASTTPAKIEQQPVAQDDRISRARTNSKAQIRSKASLRASTFDGRREKETKLQLHRHMDRTPFDKGDSDPLGAIDFPLNIDLGIEDEYNDIDQFGYWRMLGRVQAVDNTGHENRNTKLRLHTSPQSKVNPFNPATYALDGYSRPMTTYDNVLRKMGDGGAAGSVDGVSRGGIGLDEWWQRGFSRGTERTGISSRETCKLGDTRAPGTANRPVTTMLPVLSRVLKDRGGSHHHHKHEVCEDPNLNQFMPLMSTKSKSWLEERRVDVTRLCKKTMEFFTTYDIDAETGEPLQNLRFKERALRKLTSLEDQMDFLHHVFLHLVRSCVDVDEGSKDSDDEEDRRPKDYQMFDSTKISFEASFAPIRSRSSRLRPLDEVKSKGAVIRRTIISRQRTLKHSDPIRAQLETPLKNPSGITTAEKLRVKEFFNSVMTERKKGREPLDHCGRWREAVLTLSDWVRERDGRIVSDKDQFSAGQFILEYVRLHTDLTDEDEGGVFADQKKAKKILSKLVKKEMLLSQVGKNGGLGSTTFGKSAPSSQHHNIGLSARRSTASTATGGAGSRRSTASMMNPHYPGRRSTAGSGAGMGIGSRTSSMLMIPPMPSFVGQRAPRQSTSNRSPSMLGPGTPMRRTTRRPSHRGLHLDDRLHTAAEILSSPVLDVFRVYHNECVAILKKPGDTRTKLEIVVIERVMRRLAAFQGLSDFIITETCKSMTYQFIETDRVIFRQGDPALFWYIILSGAVDVQISVTGKLEDSKAVKRINAGEGFGDLGLLNDQARAATIVTVRQTELVLVQKEDYNRVLRFVHQKHTAEMVNFLKSIPIFQDWTASALKAIAGKMSFREMPPGSVILEEGKRCDNLYFIKSGVVHVQKNLKHRGRKHSVHITSIGPKSYFGEEGVIYDQDDQHYSKFTHRAASHGERDLEDNETAIKD
ncbi:hypothetical protein HDU76_005534, partial [Blyttiomyces sp. JEL0837]